MKKPTGPCFRAIATALAITVAPVASTAASAHSFWLEPETHTVAAGEEVKVDFRIGDAGEAQAWGLYWERIASFRLYGPDGVVDQQMAVRTTGPGEVGSARITAPEAGSYILAFESTQSFSDLEAARFDAYVADEGLTAIAAHREAIGSNGRSGTELYSRRAKTLLLVGDARTGNVTQPIGQTLEIVPLQNPFELGMTQPLELKVLWRGEPLAGATLRAVPLDGRSGPITFRTRNNGIVTLPMTPRPMLYSVVWGVPAPNDARADYITVFASLTVASQ